MNLKTFIRVRVISLVLAFSGFDVWSNKKQAGEKWEERKKERKKRAKEKKKKRKEKSLNRKII